jgi:hypothetical protein
VLPPHPNVPTLVGAGLTAARPGCPVGASPARLFLRLRCGGRRVTTLPFWVAAESRDSLAVLRVAFQVLQVGRSIRPIREPLSRLQYTAWLSAACAPLAWRLYGFQITQRRLQWRRLDRAREEQGLGGPCTLGQNAVRWNIVRLE